MLWVVPASGVLTQLEVTEHPGLVRTLNFTTITRSAPPAADAFLFSVPRGVTVVDQAAMMKGMQGDAMVVMVDAVTSTLATEHSAWLPQSNPLNPNHWSTSMPGTRITVEPNTLLEYNFGDRICVVTFSPTADGTTVRVSFDAEEENSVDLQRGGWQAILDNFATHVEGAR